MFRYIGFVWDPQNRRAALSAHAFAMRIRHSSPEWRTVHTTPGLSVCVTGETSVSRALPLSEGYGAVLGTIFPYSVPLSETPSSRIDSFDREASERILATPGECLSRAHWGRFVAFVTRPDLRETYVVRAAASALPAYYTRADDVTVVFSHLPDCSLATRAQFSVDWRELAIYLGGGGDRIDTSVLQGVSTLYPGQCLVFSTQGVRTQSYWDPVELACNPIDDLSTAVTLLRTSAIYSVSTWASCYKSIVLRLSGGYDSTAVAAIMGHAAGGTTVNGLNFYASDHASDERRFARLVAGRYNFPLLEKLRNETIDLSRGLTAHATPVPGNTIDSLSSIADLRELSKRVGGQAVFSGQHGDNLFYHDRVRFAAIDAARNRKTLPRAIQLISQVSKRSQVTIWTLIRDALWYGVLHREWTPRSHFANSRGNSLLHPDVLRAARESNTLFLPWLSDARALPPGKFSHIHNLFAPSPYYDPYHTPDDPELTDPLLSQPLVDACLRIPTYIHTFNSERRAAIRRALVDLVPPEISNRRWKSRVGRHVDEIIGHNISFCRDSVEHGRLQRENFLKLKEVANVFGMVNGAGHSAQLLRVLDIETWLSNLASLNKTVLAAQHAPSVPIITTTRTGT